MTIDEFIDRLLGRTVISPEIYTADIVVLNLLISMGLALMVAETYRRTHRGISYSQSYVYSIVMVSMTVALAMMVIGNDITRAFALLGTFTIIRYRTAVKDPKDTAFIFMALVVGLAVGSSNYGIAIAGSLTLCLAALLLDWFDFGSAEKLDSVLYLQASAGRVAQTDLENVMRDNFSKAKLLNLNYLNSDDLVMYAYNIVLSTSTPADEAIGRLMALDGVQSAEMLSAHNVVEF